MRESAWFGDLCSIVKGQFKLRAGGQASSGSAGREISGPADNFGVLSRGTEEYGCFAVFVNRPICPARYVMFPGPSRWTERFTAW